MSAAPLTMPKEAAVEQSRTEVREPIFTPDPAVIAASQMTAFRQFCEAATGRALPDFAALQRFSVDEFRQFWTHFLAWSAPLHEGDVGTVCTSDVCKEALFFPDLRLSYTENLLSSGDAAQPAVTARNRLGQVQRLTRGELRARVGTLAGGLRAQGVAPGDRVGAIVPNTAEAVVGSLAVVGLGATLATASPEMGVTAIVSRFAQLEPTLLMCQLRSADPRLADGLRERLAEIVKALPSLRALVVLDDESATLDVGVPVLQLPALIAASAGPVIDWPRLPFNHPLFILFSSGTTGKPKCLVHGSGGTLLEHLKEHRLHGDMKPGDKLFFQTSTAWMMWHWQLSALGCGAEIVLYDGPVDHPEVLWRIVAEERVTVFGTSPGYLSYCDNAGFRPADRFGFEALRAMLSTGSVLYDNQFDWVAEQVKHLPLQSISGGSDIIGCFVLGNPALPVFRGESQCRSLGLDVAAVDEDGRTMKGGIGELVCRNPFPSRPSGLFGDLEGTRFHETYFAQHRSVWTHGDFIEFMPEGSARLHGRSDSVLKVRGIRVGPAEIYQILQTIPAIVEAMAVEQEQPGLASRLILLVVLKPGQALDRDLIVRIKQTLLHAGSPAMVPDAIAAVDALPRTFSGKRSERAARDAINGRMPKQMEALENPGCLTALACHPALRAPALVRLGSRPVTADPGLDEAALLKALPPIWEAVLGFAPIAPHESFFDLGGHSLLAVRLVSEIREILGYRLAPATIFKAPTIAAMARLMADGTEAANRSCLVLLKSGRARAPLFLIHDMPGNALIFGELARSLPGPRPVYGVHARGLEGEAPPATDVAGMATDYLAQIRALQPQGPYALGGFSFGGLVAFEIACRLRAQGQEVELLALLDSYRHEGGFTYQLRRAARVARELRQHPFRDQLGVLRERITRLRHRATLGTRYQRLAGAKATPLIDYLRMVDEASWVAHVNFRPSVYPGRVRFFRALVRDGRHRADPSPAWLKFADNFEIIDVPGSHVGMLREPHAAVLAARLAALLDESG